MSLILDALRKSEAERRRGQSPDLFSTSSIAVPASRPGLRWWPVAVFIVLLLASAWVVWDGRTQRAADHAAPLDDVAASGPDAGAGDEPADSAPAQAPHPDGIAMPPVSTAATPPPVASPPATSAPAAETNAPAAGPAPAPVPARAALVPALPTTPAAAAQPLPALPLEPPASEAPADEALPSLAVLDSITRGTLPPLKLSMHVWGQEPGKRFAIVDGQRVAEGSLLGNGVVEQIRRDGVVINVNGQRLLLPKP